MRATQTKRRIAFTLIELLVMIVTLVMLGVLLFAGVPRVRKEARLKQCVNNLKQVGLAFRIWSSDGDRYQMQILSSEGGAKEYVLNGEVFRAFQVMSNELGFNANLLICPADNRQVAFSFTNGFSNDHVSYFVGVDATDIEPIPRNFKSPLD